MEVLDAKQDRPNVQNPGHSPSDPLLRVSDLTVHYRWDSEQESQALKDVSFAISPGTIIGLLGESGCGKSTAALSILRLLSPSARVTAGSVEFYGTNLYQCDDRALGKIRGAEISIIYQDSSVLNPVMRVGDQVLEVLRAHTKLPFARMREKILSLFATLGLEDRDRIYRAYPHQLSGGQRRRIAIAQALICGPRLVIADEPTAGLDSATTAAFLDLIVKLRDLHNIAFLLISHDPEMLAAVTDEILVMYAGEIVERGHTRTVFALPMHPYTEALLRCSVAAISRATESAAKNALPCIPGDAPDPAGSLPGCAFASRCRDRMAVCEAQTPELIEISPMRSARCFKYGKGA
jgi:peptide/nickel transport system ATP-binding protein